MWEPMVYPFEEETSFLREDEVGHVLSQQEALENAKSVTGRACTCAKGGEVRCDRQMIRTWKSKSAVKRR